MSTSDSDSAVSLSGCSSPRPEETKELTLDEFRRIVFKHGLSLKPQDEEEYLFVVRDVEKMVEYVNDLPEYIDPRLVPSLQAQGRTYTVQSRDENPLNAWSHRFELKDTKAISAGLLRGRSVAIKDTVSIAGIPFTLGTQPYHLSKSTPYPIPTIDAPVVSRILAAGGVVTGTSTCENYCMSGLSSTSATGPVENPWLRGCSSGGSSSGSAVLVAINAVKSWHGKRGLPIEDLGEGADFAIGGDQGGSIRLPAALSGTYGLKPTHGLVPYTGIASLHPLIDHCGPMASSVRDVALLLSVIAGYDGIDPRMTPESPLRRAAPQYHVLLDQATTARQLRGEWTPSTAGKGLRVGVLKEGLEIPSLSPDVATVIRKAAQRFEDLGATVTEVSVGHIHHDALAVWAGVIRGQMHEVLLGNRAPDLLSHPLPNLTPPVPDQKWYETMTVSNPAVISALLTGSYLADTKRFGNGYRGKALMHAQQLRDAYDTVFEGVDVVIMPTTPFVAPRQGKHAGGGEGVMENFRAQAHLASNTAPFNITGHPALSMPVGWAPVDGGGEGKLPVGMQIVGRRWDELGVLFAAAAWEVGGFGLDDES